MSQRISVVLATGDDMLRPILGEVSQVQVMGMVYNEAQVLEAVAEFRPKVIVLAEFMDPELGNTRLLRNRFPGTRVVYIITSENQDRVRSLLIQMGIYDFLSHTFKKSELVKLLLYPRGWQELCASGLVLEEFLDEFLPKAPLEEKKTSFQEWQDLHGLEGLSSNYGVFEQGASQVIKEKKTDRESKGVHGVTNFLKSIADTLTRQKENKLNPAKDVSNQGVVNPYQHEASNQGLVSPHLAEGTSQGVISQKAAAINSAIAVEQATVPIASPIRQEDTTPITGGIQAGCEQHPKSPKTSPIKVVRQQVVAFWSGKSGTGKTFLAVNTALALARAGVKVALVDGDIVNLSIGVHLNLQDVKKTLERALKVNQPEDITEYLLYHPQYPNLAVLSGSEFCRAEGYYTVDKEAVVRLIQYLKADFDVVIIDTATDLQVVTTFVALQQATRVIMVADQDYAQVFAAKRQLALLKRLRQPLEKYQLVLNGEVTASKLKASLLENMLGLKLIKVLPFLPVQAIDSIFDSQPIVLQKGKDTNELRMGLEQLAHEVFPVVLEERISILQNLTRVLSKKESISYG